MPSNKNLFIALNKKVRFFSLKAGVFFIKAIIYGIVSLIVTKGVFTLLSPIDTSVLLKIVRTGISCVAGVGVYGIFIILFERKLIKELKKN